MQSVAGEFDRCATNVKDIVISSGELPTDVTALVKIQVRYKIHQCC